MSTDWPLTVTFPILSFPVAIIEPLIFNAPSVSMSTEPPYSFELRPSFMSLEPLIVNLPSLYKVPT